VRISCAVLDGSGSSGDVFFQDGSVCLQFTSSYRRGGGLPAQGQRRGGMLAVIWV
jgi:hypothetical protein